MIKPTIHLNGSGKENLTQQYENAWDAIDKAIDTLSKASPHGRDYYPQGDSVINIAIAEHAYRIIRLQDVRAEIQQLLESVIGY